MLYAGALLPHTQKVFYTFCDPNDLLASRPDAIIERAIKGMLPKNRLGRKMYKKLFVYAGAEHQHKAQMPKELKF